MVVITTTVGAGALAFVFSCNLHEIGHAAVGTAFGWEVDRISFCLPGDGAVHYHRSTERGDTVESWSGGIVGALSLVVAYAGLVARRSGPLRSPIIWAAGLGLSISVFLQLVIAALEGTSGTTDYTETIADSPILWGGILALAGATGPIVHLWTWRRVLARGPTTPSTSERVRDRQ